jgi:hypothetical protein
VMGRRERRRATGIQPAWRACSADLSWDRRLISFLGGSVQWCPKPEAETDHRTSGNSKPKPKPKTEKPTIRFGFGSVRFGDRFSVKKCPALTASKNFSVKNMYNDLVLKSGTPVNCWTWKAKIPLKIKIFLWYVKSGVMLTNNNLVKRQWKGCTKCCFLQSKKLFCTCFLIVLWLGLCGGLFVLLLGLQNQ